MKKVLLACIIVFSALFLSAGNWNPYVTQGMVSPASLVPSQLNGTGIVSFNVGNLGSNPLNLVRNQEMKLIITLSDGAPNVTPLNATTALTVIEGTGASWFNWSYNILTNSYTGIQNRTIPAQSQGFITIQYKVTVNSPQGTPANGFNVNLTPPPYTNGINKADDDAISSYTFTEAYNGIDDKEGSQRLIIYSYEDNIYVKELTGKELNGKMAVYNLVGQRVAKNALTGGSLNKFNMTLEEGYYVVEVFNNEKTYHGKVYLMR